MDCWKASRVYNKDLNPLFYFTFMNLESRIRSVVNEWNEI